MKKLILFLFLLPATLWAQQAPLEQNYIEVTERVQKTVFPDQLWYSFWFPEAEGSTLEKRLTKINAFIAERGLSAKNLVEAAAMDSELPISYAWLSNSAHYFLNIPRIEMVDEITEYLEEIGARQIEFAFAQHSGLAALEASLYETAMKQAQASARSILNPAGQAPGKVIFVQDMEEQGNSRSQGNLKAKGSAQKVMGVTRKEISFSPWVLSVVLKVRFSIN